MEPSHDQIDAAFIHFSLIQLPPERGAAKRRAHEPKIAIPEAVLAVQAFTAIAQDRVQKTWKTIHG